MCCKTPITRAHVAALRAMFTTSATIPKSLKPFVVAATCESTESARARAASNNSGTSTHGEVAQGDLSVAASPPWGGANSLRNSLPGDQRNHGAIHLRES